MSSSTSQTIARLTLVCALAGASLLAQGLTLSTGTWKYTMTVDGAIPLDGVPENMRATIEAQFKQPRTFTGCLTAEDLKSVNLGRTDDSADEDCTVLSSKMGPTGGDITRQCTGERARTETVHVEALSPQAMRAVITSKTPTGTMTTTMTGTWVAAQCND
ncbi:MAG: DUF3617 family protein [Vicinamibacterales bacterium]